MNTTTGLLLATALALAPLTVRAEGAIGGYLWKGAEDTAGIGAKGWFGFGGPMFFSGRLQTGDAFDFDYNEARAGVGLGVNVGTLAVQKVGSVYAGIEAVRIDVEDEDDIGLAFFAGASFAPADRLSLDVEFGIVDAGELGEGPFAIPLEASEFSLGATYALNDALGFFVERSEEVLVGDVTQVGVRLSF